MMINPKLLSHKRIGVGHYPVSDTVDPCGKVLLPVGGPEPFMLYTENFGADWQIKKGGDSDIACRYKKLRDGSFISFEFENQVHDKIPDRRQKKVPFIIGIHRAASIEDIADGRIDTEFCSVDIPNLAFGYGDSGNSHSGTVDHGVAELDNGDIIITMYGQRTTDTTLCPYFEKNCGYTFYLYSSWCLISHDGGHTFSYLSSIADTQTYPIADVNAEGYCEPDIMYLGGGHLVCILRTGGHEIASPLYCCHSYDCGASWSAPYEICGWGVMPKLLKMSDGTLVCLSGHIHTMLLFSRDDGLSWSEPFIIEPCDGKWDKSASGYGTVFESAPGELTIIYDDPKEGIAEGAESGYLRNVYIRRYKIF